MLLFSIKKGERLGTLQSWQHDGGEKSFGSQIEAIVPSGNRLYVAERQSRIHVSVSYTHLDVYKRQV